MFSYMDFVDFSRGPDLESAIRMAAYASPRRYCAVAHRYAGMALRTFYPTVRVLCVVELDAAVFDNAFWPTMAKSAI
jgi:hypothetical protein